MTKEFSLLKPMHPSRVKIMDLLTQQHNATCRHMAHELGGVSTSVVTHHLKVLVRKGNLQRIEKKGKMSGYKIIAYSNPPTESYYDREF